MHTCQHCNTNCENTNQAANTKAHTMQHLLGCSSADGAMLSVHLMFARTAEPGMRQLLQMNCYVISNWQDGPLLLTETEKSRPADGTTEYT